MTTITIRAADAVTAMDMVQRRLGDDALILSTTSVAGGVEIIATDDPLPEQGWRRPSVPGPDPVPRSMPEALPEALPETGPAPLRLVAPVVAAPVPFGPARYPRAAAAPADDPAPDPAALPTFLTRRSAAAAPVVPPPVAAPSAPAVQALPPAALSHFGAVLQRRLVQQAPRVVLFGPAGAGKSVVAVQLALLRRADKTPPVVRFFFCGSGSRSDGALLAQKSHLLGMETVFCTPDTLPDPAEGAVQIIVISARSQTAPDAARIALGAGKGLGVLVLPGGLRADAVAGFAALWRDPPERAILSQPHPRAPMAADLAQIGAAGIVPLWVSAPDLLVGGLDPALPVAPAATPVTDTLVAEPRR